MAIVEAGIDHRAADRAAELMPVERRHRILHERAVCGLDLADEKVARVERVVAQELVARAVKLIGARLRRDRHHTGAASELGRETPDSTLNSRTCSTEGATMTVLNVNSLLSMPSTSQRVGVGLASECVEVRRAARVEGARA